MTDKELRRAVRTVWEEVLGADVDDDTDFFDAGGTSFAALRIVATLNSRHAIAISVKALFENSRFTDFAAAVDQDPGLTRPA
ncbi:phosphopantetheine-binding protein [Streptomyces sp. CA-146814]|uniref:phosphopantetheine-binding protein n=1 Tax=Streptomyces sp. CA-146814 TaxID=3240053 RepID=UPI003D8CDF2B